MANIPDLRSKEQIAGELIDGIRARLRKDIDLNNSSTLLQIIEAIAQGQFKSAADIISMIDADSVDRAEGEQLQRIARDKNVPIFPSQSSTGRVSISDTSFAKISSRIYAGQPAPVAGSIKIYVPDASSFPSSGGKLYIGRGTTNVEGPLTYVSTASEAGGAYWSITLASTSPTTKFHNLGEAVVLAQGGNRFIPSNASIQTAQGASITAVGFVTTSAATIIDGEVTVTDVPVRCSVPGTIGNVSKGSIKEIVGVPFPGSVSNDLAFSNGRDADTEDDIKERIKAYEQAKAKGTEAAIETASKDVVAKDELKKVQSSSIVRYADNTTELVFDDGTGYEPLFVGAPFETVVDSAVGGEKEVQLRQKPIAQARVKNSHAGPYPMTDLSLLAVTVAGVQTVHQFLASDFKVPSSATPFEVAASINGNSAINFLCSTSDNGSQLVLYPKDRKVNDIQVSVPSSGIDANVALGFPLLQAVTLRLYKNDLPMQQDGVLASVSTRAKTSWSPAISAGDTLKYQVDGTPEVTATFNLTDFQAVDASAIVSSLTAIATWAQVFNNLMPGVKATVVGDTIRFDSARGFSDVASLRITGGTLKNQIFETGVELFGQGQASDFTFNKNTGQLGFADALIVGDKITAGSQFTRASALTASIPSGPASNGRLWLLTDGGSQSIPNGLKSNTQVSFAKSGTLLTISSQSPSLVPEGFEDAKEGDWIIVWANAADPAPLISNQGFWRIQSVTTGTVIVDDGTTSRSNLNLSFTPITDRVVLVRSTAPMQLLDFTADTLVNFTSAVKNNLTGVDAIISGSKVRISTKTFSSDGEIFFAAADAGGAVLELPTSKSILLTTGSQPRLTVKQASQLLLTELSEQ
jgi:alkylated DNA nucleotide flippase Atl1